MESRIRSILKYISDIAEVLGPKGSVTLKALSIYKDCSMAFFKISLKHSLSLRHFKWFIVSSKKQNNSKDLQLWWRYRSQV